MFQNCKNSKKQGDAGLGIAIGWFASTGVTVLIPLTDSQDYDLVIDDGVMKKVQVKTSTHRSPYGKWLVELRTKGGNRSGTGKEKKFDPKAVDLVFVVTGDGDNYLIPADEMESKTVLSLGDKYSKFKLGAVPYACL